MNIIQTRSEGIILYYSYKIRCSIFGHDFHIIPKMTDRPIVEFHHEIVMTLWCKRCGTIYSLVDFISLGVHEEIKGDKDFLGRFIRK